MAKKSELQRKKELDDWFAETLASLAEQQQGFGVEDPKARISRIQNLLKPDAKVFNQFAKTYFDHIVKVDFAPIHLKLYRSLVGDMSFTCAVLSRGLAKTTVGRLSIIHLLLQKKVRFVVMASSSEGKALKLLGEMQAELLGNGKLQQDYNIRIRSGHFAQGDFQVVVGEGRAAYTVRFMGVGKRQNPRGLQHEGQRPDLIWLDDIDDDMEVRNTARVRTSVDWVMGALYGAVDFGNHRVLALNNLIGKETIMTHLMRVEGAKVFTANLTDGQGRSTWAARYSDQDCQRMISRSPYRVAQREYFNNPISEGAVFKRAWIRFEETLPHSKYKAVVAYYDPSWSENGDYKAICVVGKTGKEFHVLDWFCRQCGNEEVVKWCYEYSAKHPSVQWYMEAGLMQAHHLEAFRDHGAKVGRQLVMRPDKRAKKDKYTRIEACSGYFEAGLVVLNRKGQTLPDTEAAIEQLLSFEQGSNAHDDAPDALEGALSILNTATRLTDTPLLTAPRDNYTY